MELELVYNEETKEWEQKPEPFITIECETEEDFKFIGNAIAFHKKYLAEQEKPQTNADRIRAMSDEELAWELMTWRIETEAKHHGVESNYPNTQKSILEWLKQPAEGE